MGDFSGPIGRIFYANPLQLLILRRDYNMKKNGKGKGKGNGKKIYLGKMYSYEVMSNCPRCKGAVFPLDTRWHSISHLFKCFQCSRMFKLKNGKYVLWPPKRTSRKAVSQDDHVREILSRW